MFSFNKIQPTTSTSGLSTSTSQPNFFGQQPQAATAGAGQPQQQAGATGGGLFSFNKPADQPATGGGLFGGGTNPQANTSGGIFGSLGNKPTTATTGGLNTTSTFGSGLLLNKPTATASPFGQAATTTTTGGIFGGLGSQPGKLFF